VERPAVVNTPLVSVIIVTRDREQELRRCVESILNSAYQNIEVVIFDNSSRTSRKKTREFLSSVGFERELRYIESAPRGFAEMRQMAVHNSRGDIIVSIDDDCVAGKDAISEVVRRFSSDERIGIVGGNINNIGFEGDDVFKGRGRIGVNGRYEVVRDARDAQVFGSANMSMRRKAFDEAGGYDLFFSGGFEEADLTLSIRSKGYEVVYEPRVRITHYHSASRFRSRWRNMDVYRLYLFFKHFMPESMEEWVTFSASELQMLIADLDRLVFEPMTRFRKRRVEDHAASNGNRSSGYLRAGCRLLIELSKVTIARLMIPYLMCKAYRTRST
jgi:GT2 family glycosyltransferase